jgi:hypothetical protein
MHLKTAFALLCAALLSLVCANSRAVLVLPAGYDQFCGLPIIVAPNPQGASASTDQFNRAAIYVDPSIMADATASRMFTIAHECAHHRLGHTLPQGMWFRNSQYWATKQQELAADCWAAEQLKNTQGMQDVERAIRQFVSQGSAAQGNYPSGLERAYAAAGCAGVRVQPPGMSCEISSGYCPLAVQLRVGAPCYCPTPAGRVEGVAQ